MHSAWSANAEADLLDSHGWPGTAALLPQILSVLSWCPTAAWNDQKPVLAGRKSYLLFLVNGMGSGIEG